MATDFFARQDHARRQTRLLVGLFAAAVAAIVAAIYLAAVLIFGEVLSERATLGRPAAAVSLWQPELFLWIAPATILVIALGSLYKIAELASGGEKVALMLGGRLVHPQTTDLAERRLLNVVEEMSLASGVAVPPVYVLDGESSINAFAAGHQPGDAVVAVSRGCLNYLNRDELQGVVAHEFSHILNGDMRLNLRLVGLVHGILLLAIIGYYIIRFTSSSRSSSSSKKKDGAGAVVLFGLALLVLGYVGVFFGKLIRSALSRQREFLADASAVQFTRYPGGIAGALKKIGGLAEGSRIKDSHAEEISHMFFGDAFAGAWFNWFATHPPLDVRIQALEPDFDGRFPAVRALAPAEAEPSAEPRAGLRRLPLPPILVPGLAAAAPAAVAVDPAATIARIGSPATEHLDYAAAMLADLPPELSTSVREPYSARAVIGALLLNRQDAEIRGRQLDLLRQQAGEPLAQQTARLAELADRLGGHARLPLVELANPALRSLCPDQYAAFRRTVEALVAADGKIDLFEYSIRAALLGSLDVHFGLRRPAVVRYRALRPLTQPIVTVLSLWAQAGHSRPEDVLRAYRAGAEGLVDPTEPLAKEQCGLAAFDSALGQLAQATPAIKKRVLTGCAACVAVDGQTTLVESELLRAVSALLGCPLPPQLPSPAMEA